VELDQDEADTFLDFYAELDDHDDVQAAFANCELPDDFEPSVEVE
jgi:transcriptional/translational regulatory protein YebC/TACO1